MYENERPQVLIVHNNNIHTVLDQKSKFFYTLLVDKKSSRSHIEKYWTKEFSLRIEKSEWKKIYIHRIHCLPSKKFAEFAYKLVHNLIPNRKTLYKWKKSDTDLCPLCTIVETTKHIYFECKRVTELWKKVGIY